MRLQEIRENIRNCTDEYADNSLFIQDIEYLLNRIERYEKALKDIANFDDGIIRQYQELEELVGIYEDIAKEALKEE